MTAITAPGVYDIPADVYHDDPVPGGSLSSSGARRLLKTCPAKFHYEQRYPPTPTSDMEFGTIAHKTLLGIGPELVIVEAANWRSKADQQTRKEARARGAVALLEDEYLAIQQMVKAIREHPIAGALFSSGQPEQALFWRDAQSGIWRRALVDWLRDTGASRLLIPDYKTCDAADDESVQRAIVRFNYHMQGAWYLDAVQALGLDDAPAFLLVCQEREPPYLVNVVEPDAMAMRIGRHRNREAIDLYARCKASGHWPGYGDDVSSISLPGWIEHRYLEEITS